MKKSKYIIFGFTICFMTFLIISILLNYVDINSKIKVKNIENFDIKISSINENIDKIKNDDCKSVLKLMSNKIQNTYYESNVSVKKYIESYFFTDNSDYYSLYISAKEVCDYSDDSIDELVIASKTYPQSVKARYDSNYEIDFKDYFNRNKINEISDEVGTYSTKTLELNSLKEYVNGVIKHEKNL